LIHGFKTKNITINGRKIRYFQAGTSGPEILLIHGCMIDSSKLSWGIVAPMLAEKMRVTAVDLPGFGGSEAPRGSINVATYSAFIDRFLKEIGINKTAIAGISLGGQVAMAMSAFYPERVSRIYLIASGGLSQSKALVKAQFFLTRTPKFSLLAGKLLGRSHKVFKTLLNAMFFDHDKITDDFVMSMIQEFKNTPALATFTKFNNSELTKDGRRSDLVPMLKDTKIPTMLIHGQFDLTFPPVLSQDAAAEIKGADLRIIPKCGHWVTRDRPETVAAFLSEFTVR